MTAEAFNRASGKKERAGTLATAIRRERPDLKRKNFMKPEYGNRSHVLIAGGEVFKGPRSEGLIAELDREYETLKRLQGQGLLVPELTCQGIKSVFFGMKQAEGIPLERIWTDLLPQQCDALAKDIGVFIAGMDKAFSSVVTHTAPEEGYNVDPSYLMKKMDTAAMRKNLGADYEFCRAEAAAYYKRLENRRVIACHTDLHPENLLVDAQTKKLTCVTDFGAVSHNLSEDALASMIGWTKPDFQEKVWSEYARLRADVVDPREFHAARLVSLIRGMDDKPGRQAQETLKFAVSGLKRMAAPPC